MAKAKEWVVIECPKCGPKTRAEVLKSAYQGGWCVGTGTDRTARHRAVNYVVVKEVTHS